MRNPFVASAGGVVSADIAVPDHERELAFYARVLTTGESPLWRDDLMNNLGTPIIGLGERTPEYENLPLQWMPHFQVSDIAMSVENTTKLGGKVILHSTTEEGESQWAALEDPFGAAFGIIPVVDVSYLENLSGKRFGHIAWLSLTVPDAVACSDFYECVLGWKAKPFQETDTKEPAVGFEMICEQGNAVAEIGQSNLDDHHVPSAWLIHLPVDDFEASLQRVKTGGGEVISATSAEHSAIIRDPVGVHFALRANPSISDRSSLQ